MATPGFTGVEGEEENAAKNKKEQQKPGKTLGGGGGKRCCKKLKGETKPWKNTRRGYGTSRKCPQASGGGGAVDTAEKRRNGGRGSCAALRVGARRKTAAALPASYGFRACTETIAQTLQDQACCRNSITFSKPGYQHKKKVHPGHHKSISSWTPTQVFPRYVPSSSHAAEWIN